MRVWAGARRWGGGEGETGERTRKTRAAPRVRRACLLPTEQMEEQCRKREGGRGSGRVRSGGEEKGERGLDARTAASQYKGARVGRRSYQTRG